MKKFMFCLIIVSIVGLNAAFSPLHGDSSAVSLPTAASVFKTALAAASLNKGKGLSDYKADTYKSILAALWDLLPEESSVDQSVKSSGRETFYSIYGVYPESIDLTKMTQYISLKEACSGTSKVDDEKIAALTAQVAEQTKQLAAMTAEKKAMDDADAKTLTEWNACKSSLATNAAQLTALQAAKAASDKELSDLKTAKASSDKEITDLKTAATASAKQLADLEATHAVSQKQLATLSSSISEYSSSLVAIVNAIEAVQRAYLSTEPVADMNALYKGVADAETHYRAAITALTTEAKALGLTEFTLENPHFDVIIEGHKY